MTNKIDSVQELKGETVIEIRDVNKWDVEIIFSNGDELIIHAANWHHKRAE